VILVASNCDPYGLTRKAVDISAWLRELGLERYEQAFQVDLRRLCARDWGLETKADEIALVYAVGRHTLARAGPRT
jgi:hypothetical protein